MKKALLIIILFAISFSSFSQVEITEKEVYNHINYLASDEMKGRFPGTPEDGLAAEYILDEFKNLGLTPLFEDGLQYFEIETGAKVVGNKSLNIGGFSCKYVEEYEPLLFSKSGKFSGETVFAGYGMNIEGDDQTWNDYENIDATGKWVVMFRGKPNVENYPATFFDNFTKEYSKVLEATDQGAIGVIFINGYENFPDDKLVVPCNSRFSEKAAIPAYSVKRFTGDRLLGYADIKVEDVEKEIKENGKPVAFELNVFIKNNLTIEPVNVKTHNVVAFIEGNDENLRNEYIVIGAHYDHLGFGGCGSGSTVPERTGIHNGADDNASGVAGVLEIAEFLAGNKDKLGRSVIFIAFGAEERGLLGSDYFVNNLPADKNNIYAMLNMDMLGKYDGKLDVMGVGTAVEFNDIFNSVDYDTTKMTLKLHKKAYSSSDHASFIKKGIPSVFFYASSGKYYHTPEDDVEFIDAKSAAIVMTYIANSAIKLSNYNDTLTFVEVENKKSGGHSSSGMVKLGVVPAFEETNNTGMMISGVTEDGPALKAGMQGGDKITAINDEVVNNIYDYMARLQKLKPGDLINVKIVRDGKEKIIEIQL